MNNFTNGFYSKGVLQRLAPWFVTGFSDAEGTFIISITKNDKLLVGWEVKAMFKIGLHIRDLNLLEQIQKFFGVGKVSIDINKNFCVFHVHSLEEIVKFILPHFNEYPLLSNKGQDFLLFKDIVMLMYNNKAHLNKEGLQKIINLKASLNNGLTAVLAEAFPFTISAVRPNMIAFKPEQIDKFWIAGISSGDGTFKIDKKVSKTHKSGYQISLTFEVTQNSRDELLLRALIDRLGCGRYYFDIRNNTGTFTVKDFSSIYSIIIPLFLEHKILGVKALDIEDFCRAAEIINKGDHLTDEGAAIIIGLKSGMNRGRVESTFIPKRSLPEGTLYIYNKDQTVLYYCTTNLSDIINDLNIQINALNKHLINGTLYLKNFTFSNNLIPGAQEQIMTLADLSLKLKRIRDGKKSK